MDIAAPATLYSYPSQSPRHDAALAAPAPESSPLFSGDAPSFKDLVDVVNPLQQLPIIGTLYRSLTGDTLSTGASLLGGALFGGPIGLLASAVNAGLKAASGGDIGDHVLALLQGGESSTQVANAASAAAQYQKAQQLG